MKGSQLYDCCTTNAAATRTPVYYTAELPPTTDRGPRQPTTQLKRPFDAFQRCSHRAVGLRCTFSAEMCLGGGGRWACGGHSTVSLRFDDCATATVSLGEIKMKVLL